MIPTSRKQALQIKATQYYSGPCKHGHDAPRRTKTGECLECRKIALYRWRIKNPEKVKQHNQKQYMQYEVKKAEWHRRSLKYRVSNPDKVIANTRRYQIAKHNRVPRWLTSEEHFLIREIYALARIRTSLTGIAWHVDHIIPLRGELVSGLHVPENLQVIPGIINTKKSNSYIVM